MAAPVIAAGTARAAAGRTAFGTEGAARARARGASQVSRGKPRQRIGKPVAGLMVAMAVIIDFSQFVINFVPVLGQFFGLVLSFIAFVSFALWFALLGVNFFTGRKAGLKMVSAFGTTLIELVPLVQALPSMTIGVTVTIIASWLEDAENKKKALEESRDLARLAREKDNEYRARIERFRSQQALSSEEALPT